MANPTDYSDVIADINRSLKANILKMGNDPDLRLQLVPTGITPLDEVLGGGIPRGRFCLVVGNFSTGKTFFCQRAIKTAQDAGLTTAYIDTERAFNPEWFAATGVDLARLPVATPLTGEQAFDILHILVEKEFDLVVVDSLAAMVPMSEIEEGMEKQAVGAQARLINRGLRKLFSINSNSAVMLTNQVRSPIGSVYLTETHPGGKGQDFWAWLTIKMRRKGWIMESKKGADTVRVGFNMVFAITKSKQCAPYQEVEVPFYFTGKLDLLSALLDTAIERGIIDQRAASYTWGDEKFHGRKKVLAYLEENNDAVAVLQKEVRDAPR